MEWIDYQASLCSGCGQPRHESMHPDMDGAYEAVPLQCFACAARDGENREAAEAKAGDRIGPTSLDGVYFAVQKRDQGW